MDDIEQDVALGTKVFTRVDDLRALLESIPGWISKVYVADDGERTSEKSSLYNRDYHFDLQVIDLDYDTGVGAGRNAIVEAATEEFIFIVDPDHRIPPTADLLLDQLQERPKMGGIGAVIVEPDNDRLYSQAADFREERTSSGTKLVRDPSGAQKNIEIVQDAPLVMFDFIPQATLFRRTCLNERAWDPEYQTEYEHTDFFLGHWKHTDWQFAISPSVQILHYPGGDTEYMTNRQNPDKSSMGREYFLNKWGYVEMETPGGRWIEVGSIGTLSKNFQSALTILREEGPVALFKQARQFLRNRI